MRALLLLAVVSLTACGPKPESPALAAFRMSQESAVSQTAIDAINIRFVRYLNDNLADSVASLYVEDGVMLPPNVPAVFGRAAIREFLAASPGPPGATYTFMAADVRVSGPMLVERGEYNVSVPAVGKTPAVSRNGKYLRHWRAGDGRWLLVAMIWSDDAPMPAGAAPKP